jgi:4-amino-4-deoxy-L-arabinose transferase-like glycosyltransferase
VPSPVAEALPGHRAGSTGFRATDAITVALLVGAALLLRIWLLPSFDVISIDGTGYASAASRLLDGDFSLLARYGLYPVLIAIVHLFTPNLQLAGQLVSAIMGAFLIIPVYALGLALYNRRVALCAALLVVSWPDIANLSSEVLTQATYTTLITAGIFFTWRGFTANLPRTTLLAGIMLGLALLTRTEALILPGVLLGTLAATGAVPCHSPRCWLRLLIPFGSVFLLFLGINLILVHEATGRWQLAVKTSGALRDGLMYYLDLADYSMPPELSQVSYWTVIRHFPGYIPYSLLKNLRETWQMMLSWPLWLVALAGFLAGGWQWQRARGRLFLTATLAPYLVIVLFYYVGPGYYQPYLPILLLWVGNGLDRGAELVAASPWGTRYQRLCTTVPLAVLTAGILAGNNVVHLYTVHKTPPPPSPTRQLDGRVVQKELGLMADRFLPAGKLMTRWARTGFYADRDWALIPAAGNLDNLLAEARSQGVRFLIVDPMAVNNCPQLEPLYEPAREVLLLGRALEPQVKYVSEFNIQPHPGVVLFLLYRDQKQVTAAIYEILPEDS